MAQAQCFGQHFVPHLKVALRCVAMRSLVYQPSLPINGEPLALAADRRSATDPRCLGTPTAIA